MSRRTGRALLYLAILLGLCALSTACGEEEGQRRGEGRIGEACADNLDCEAALLCLSTEQRCVRLCSPGGDDCGEGIDCQPAGDQGFCPLPPP